jgi:signal transduction histidine kinase
MSSPPTDSASHRGWPLRAYIVALTALFVAALVAGVTYTAVEAQNNARQSVDRDTAYAATTAATSIAGDLKQLQDGIVATAKTPGLSGLFDTGASCTLSFTGVGAFSTGHLDLVGPDGRVACSSSPKAAGVSYATAPWFHAALTAATLVAPYADPADGAQVALSTAPIPGSGVVIGVLDFAPAAGGLTTTLGGRTHLEFLLTSADGRTALARSIHPAAWTGRSLTGTPFARDAGQSERDDVDGTPRLYSEATVAGVGWHVYAGEDAELALAAAKSLAHQDIAYIIGTAVAVLMALLIVYRRITRPITRLDAAVRAARPASGFEPIAVAGPREVAALSQSFNRLMAEVEAELTQRRQAESHLSDSLAQVEIVDAQRRRLLDKLVTAQEEERRRIASDVHDDSVQLIAASIMRVSLIRQQSLDAATEEQLAKLQANLEGAVVRLRNLLFQLRPPSLDREGLSAALTEYFAQWAPEAGMAYSIDNRLEAEPPQNVRVALFRIAQEALTNVRKHSKASSVTVVLTTRDAGAHLEIVDDGVGISTADNDGSPVGHLGLVTMRERAELAGGWCRVHGAPERGTSVEVWLPYAEGRAVA